MTRCGRAAEVNWPRNCVVIVARGIFSIFNFGRLGGWGEMMKVGRPEGTEDGGL
jgi:hypothetical protein